MATYSSQIFRCFYTGLVVFCLLLDAAKYVSGQSVLCPEECWCLGSLVDCSKRHLTSIPTDLPTWVTMLELQSNRIASIPEGTFDRLSQLEDLDLSSNKLRRLNTSTFDGLSNLQQLKLASNKLTSLPILGQSARNLTQLIIHHNRITNISPAALRGLTSLRTLDLSYNRLGHLRTDTFPADNRLQFLLLENNRISNLQQGCLNNLRSLEVLKLNRNRIASLPRDLFTDLESLNLLELSRNELTTVDSLVFSGLESLEELSLSRNQLTDLMDGAFYGLNAIQQLELDGNELTTISRRWLFGLKSLLHLTVAHNRINETEASGWEFCPNLEYLDLSHNRLTTLEAEEESGGESGGPAAQGTSGGAPPTVGVPPWPPLLRELYINHNRITQVADEAFIQLNLLQVLDLSNNFIAWTIEDMTGAFEGLESMLRLGLANNNINSISRRAFNGLTNLQSLDFVGNDITTVENNAFEDMPELNQLLVNSSSMVCDCQMAWFPTWVKENNLVEGVDGRCAHPDTLQGMDIFSVDPEVFTCDDRLKPFIIREPETVTSLKNDNVSLICTAGSTSDVPVTLLWKKDKAIMEGANPIYFERLNPSGVNEYTSVLSLPHIKEDDQGRYQCIISNEFGVTYSKKARVTVHIFPSFTVTPSHVSVRVGGIAELPCAATGHPTPKIAWQKDGGINFPAARQRRIKVKTELAEFYIDNVQLSDTGVYTCTAINAAGTISTNATLTVLEPPLFTSQMKDLTVEVGEPAVLECNVEGSPRPSIRWFKDEEPFTPSDGMHLTDFDRYLIIMNAGSRDGGSYTCEASNSLGVRTDSAKLVVTQNSGTIWNMTTTSIIIVVVICCILGTSLIWVVIIYHTRKRTQRYRVEEPHHHIVPPEIPSSTLNGSSEGTIHQETSSGVSSAATDKYQDENGSDCDSLDGPLGKLSTFRFANQVRMAAIFPSETKAIEPPEVAPCNHHCSIQDGSHPGSMERYCPSDSISEADRTTLERRGQLTTLPCCNGTGRSLDSAINKHMYLHHGVGGGGRVHPFRKGGSDGEEGEIEEEDEDEVFMDEAARDRLQRERLLTNSDEGLGSQTASPVNRHNYRRSNHPPPHCCHSYTSVSSPEGRCTSPSSFKIPHEHAQRGDAYSRMAMSSSSLPCNGRVPNVHLYENPTPQDRDLIENGHLCRSHNHVNSVNVNNSNTNHSPVASTDPIRQSHSIPNAISSTGNVSPGIRALLSPTSTTHQPQVQNGNLHGNHHHRPHHANRHNEKSSHQSSRKSGRHPEKHHVKSKTSPKSGQSIPRTSYLPTSNSHPAHHVTSPTLSSLTEA